MPGQIILNTLSRTQKHLSAEDIYFEVHKTYPAVGLTTVYRTLELSAQMGWVFKFDFGDGRSRYELVKGPNIRHHHHLVYTNCVGAIDYKDFVDKEIELIKETEEALSKKYNFEIKRYQIHFYGLCEKC